MSLRVWTEEERNLLRNIYSDLSNKEIQENYFPNKTVQQITGFANKNGFFKSEEFLRQTKLKNALYGLSHIGDQKGSNSPRWVQRIKTNCDNCNKDLYLTEVDYSNSEKHFCNLKCMGEWKTKYMVGENNPNFGNGSAWTEEMRRDRAELSVKILKSLGNNIKRTKPEQVIYELLESLSVESIEQYPCKYYIVDFYIPSKHLMIEVHGNFFHCNPVMNLENKRKEKIIRKDKSKNTYIAKYYGLNVLYLWEKDILENIELCELLVKMYMENDGVLNNYHSFNYKLNENNEIQLIDKVIEFDY